MVFYPQGFVNRLFNNLGYVKTPRIPFTHSMLNGRPEFLDPASWNAYNIYLTTPQLYAVIQRRGYLLASGNWQHFRTSADGKTELVENSVFVKLLSNPNPLMQGNDHMRQWNENKSVFGNNYEYILKGTSIDIAPSGLTNLPPTQIKIETTGKYYKQTEIDQIIKAYFLTINGEKKDTFTTEEINHTRIVTGTDPILGQSPMMSLHMPISNIRSAYAFRNVIMSKHGALGILSNHAKDADGGMPVTDPERKIIQETYQKNYGLSDNQMQILITSASLQWQPMAYPTKDLMLFEEIDADFRAIIDAYGLNDNLFSKEKGSTFTNLAEGLKHAYQSTIIPEAEELALNRSHIFGLLEKNEFMHLDYSHIPVLQINKKEQAEIIEKKANAMEKLVTSEIFTAAEAKEIITFD